MSELKKYNCLCYDYGSYVAVAERLGREDGFGTVYYYLPYVENGYPTHVPADIGRNVPNIVKVREWAEVIDDVDIVVFTDAHEPALQSYFKKIGKRVFGGKYATELEHDRKRLKELMSELGLPINNYTIATGMDELEESLKVVKDVYVKSMLRGDMETWHNEDYELSKSELLRMRNTLGAYASRPVFILEEPIESIAEIGLDTMTSNGLYLQESLVGIELKDTGYYGRIMPYRKLPKQLRLVTDRLSETFKNLDYRGAYSNEVMIGGDLKGYLLDNTVRFPSPPTDLMLEIYTNFPEIVWSIADGYIPTVQYKEEHGVQFIIKSDIAKTEPTQIIIPDEYKNNVKIKNLTIDEKGIYWYTPYNLQMCEIGSIVATGNSLNEAVKKAKKISESIKGFDIKINTDCIGKAQEQIRNLAKNGVNYLAG